MNFQIEILKLLYFRNRSKSRERSRRSRSHHRKSQTPPTTSAQRMEMSAAQQAQITQFLSASLSGIGPASTVHSIAHHHAPEPVRTDFSNLFHSISTSTAATAGPNATALAIAAQKAKDLLRAKKLNDKMKTSNGDSMASNGNESSRDRKLVIINKSERFKQSNFSVDDFRAVVEHENSVQGEASNSGGDRKRKRKSRWASSNDGNEKTFIPGMPTILPSNLNPDQQEAYLGNYQFDCSFIFLLPNLQSK